MKQVKVFLFVLFITTLGACRQGTVQIERDGNGALITVNLTESEMNALAAEALAESNPLLRNPEVDLQPDLIVVHGEHERRDGNGTVSGSIDLTVTVQDGSLLIQAQSINIEGVDISDERIQRFNERMQERMLRRLERGRGVMEAQSVTITEADLTATFRAERPSSS